MKVALVHDWITGMRGGERCLEAFLSIYPDADILTLIHVSGVTSALIDRHVKQTSWLSRLPGVRRYYRLLLPLYPSAAASLDLRGYDLIISLSHAAAKNVRVPPGARHICYCFTPMRYIWDQAANYFGALTPLLWPILRGLRAWDLRGSRRVDRFVAISRFVAARVRCFYGARADVVYPPVGTSWIPEAVAGPGEAFLLAGALVPYKRPELVIEAFNRLGAPLWVVGEGPEEDHLRKIAKPNITFLGRVTDKRLGELYSRCRALVFPGTEDFGLIPVECLAAGRPVIAHYSGALRESLAGVKIWEPEAVKNFEAGNEACGVFFRGSKRSASPVASEVDSLENAIQFFMKHETRFSAEVCQRQAQRFASSNFFAAWSRIAGTQVSKVSRVNTQPRESYA